MREWALEWLCVHPDNPYRRFMQGYYVVALAGAVVGVGLLAAGVEWVWGFLALLAAATMPVVVPVMAFVSVPYARRVRDIRRGNHWAHWTYGDDEWARFGQRVKQESTRMMKLAPLFGMVVALVVAGIAWLATRDTTLTLALFGIISGIGLLVAAQYWMEGRVGSRPVDTTGGKGDVYISPEGVLRPQGYLPLAALGVKLLDVVVERTESGVTVMRFKTGTVSEHLVRRMAEFEVPVPTGREAEAETLATRLRNTR